MADDITDSTGLGGLSGSELEDTSLASLDGTTGLTSPMDEVTSLTSGRLPAFPVEAFTKVMDGLNKYNSWTVYPSELGDCIISATHFLRSGCRIPPGERTMITKLMREAIPSTFEKAVEEPCQQRWPDSVQTDILECGIKLVSLIVQRLEELLRLEGAAEQAEQAVAVEEDVQMLYEAWHKLCDPLASFHMRTKDLDLPADKVEEFAADFAEPGLPPGTCVSPGDSSTSVEEILPFEHQWLANLLNAFGAKQGFALVCQVLEMQHTSYSTVDTLLAPIMKSLDYLTKRTHSSFVGPMRVVLQRMEAQLDVNPELLTDGGRDRMFQSVSYALSRIHALLARATTPQEADEQVGHVQRRFVVRLLGQSSFSKHLAAVRATNTLLKRAVELRILDDGHSIKVNVDWLRDNDIVKQLLRANLHQKQYVDQVQKVLKNLTIEGGLQEDHLELLWNLTEKVDTFEAVKNNVYAMLGELAQDFDGNQMDLLFNKFEACSSLASRQTDTMKVMNLVQQLAVSDSKGAMATRILGLLWEMVMNPEAPPELSRSPTLVDSLCHYGWAHAWPYMQRCVSHVAANDNAPTALHTLRRLCERLPPDSLHAGGMLHRETIQRLEADCQLQEVVVSSFEAFMSEVVEAERRNPQVHATEAGIGQLRFQLMEYVQFLYSFVRSQGAALPVQIYERLWHCWLQRPSTPWVLELGFQWFGNCAVCMSSDDAAHLLRGRMMALDPLASGISAWQCFLTFFKEVAVAEGKLTYLPPKDSTDRPLSMLENHLTNNLDLTGLPCMWNMALLGENMDVAHEAGNALGQLHLQLGPGLQQRKASVRKSFVGTLVEKLTVAFKELEAGREGTTLQDLFASMDVLQARNLNMQTARSLVLLQNFISKCQGRTMPLRLAHAASFLGQRLQLEVQLQGGVKAPSQQRMRIVICGNDYVGQLRRRIAAQMGVYAGQVRILHGGKELNSDALLIREARVVNGSVLQVMTTPVVLEYTQAPTDVPAYEESSPACMLAEQEPIYSMLLSIADEGPYAMSRIHASRLLGMLPTCSSLPSALHAALVARNAPQHLATILQVSGDGKRSGRAWLLYFLEAICTVLFPMRGDPQAEPPVEVLQQSFVRSGCIQVLLDSVAAVMAKPGSADPAQFMPDAEMLLNLNSTCMGLVTQLLPIIQAIASPSASAGTPMQVSPAATPRPHSSEESAQSDHQPPPLDVVGPPELQHYSSSGSNSSTSSSGGADADLLPKLAIFFMQLAHAAACYWASPTPGSAWDRSPMSDRDAELHNEAVAAMISLLNAQPDLLPQLLTPSHPFAEGLRQALTADLFTIRHDSVRSRTARLAERMARSGEGHAWVLQALLGCCSTADDFPYTCREFYELLCSLLHVPSSDSLKGQLRTILLVLVEQMASFRPAGVMDLRLEGKLMLTAALLRALGRHALEDFRATLAGPLIISLLTDFLFPEAHLEAEMWQQPQQSMAALSSELMYAAMNPRCLTPSSRKAAFELLQVLMQHDTTHLNQIVGLLSDLHYDLRRPGILGHWQYNASAPNIIRNAEGFVGLKNGSATCYMNAVFQQLFMVPGVRSALLAEDEEPAGARKESVFYHMQSTFVHLALSRQQAFRPAGIWHAFKDYDGEPVNVREHQDAQEFLTRLQDLLDQHQRDRKRQPIMQAQFGGKLTTQIVCRSVPYRSEKDEDFVQVGLDVRGKHHLEESLDFYVQSELMEGENQYLCEEAGKKVDAVKGICFKELPNTLCIHLKRFEYDYEQMTRWKIKDRFEFPLELNMYKYTKAAADAREAAEAAGDDAPLQAPPGAEYAYELRGIVVHSGTANAGHYYSYIKVRQEQGLSSAGQWFCFDDTSVDPWDIGNLERDCFGGKHIPESGYYSSKLQEVERPNSAYLLFYDRVDASGSGAEAAAAPDASAAASTPHDQSGSGSSSIAAVPIPAVEHSVPSIFEEVMASNLRTISRTHLLDREYFAFMLKIFQADLQAGSHKVRRTGATSSPSSRSQSSLQTAPATSIDLSDARSNASSGPDTPASGTMPSIALMPIVSDRSAASPSRRILDLCLHFLFRVFLRSHSSLRTDMNLWRAALSGPLDHDPHARRRLLEVAASDDMPAEHPYDDTDTLDFCTTYLLRTDQADVRLWTAEVLTLALTQAALHDEGTPLAEAEELGSSAAACEALLSRLRKGLRTEQQQFSGHSGPGGYAKRGGPPMEIFSVLAEYARLGHQQVLHLVRLNFMPAAARAAEASNDCVRVHGASQYDVLACLRVVSHVSRRWEEDERRPNPFRMDVPGPAVRSDAKAKLQTRQVCGTLLMAPYLQDEECCTLVKFLQWQAPAFSLYAVSEVMETLLHDGEACIQPQDLADAVSIRDTYMGARMEALMLGPQPCRGERQLPGLADVLVRQPDIKDVRRFTILRFLVALADTHPEVEAALLRHSCAWGLLYRWLDRNHPSQVLYSLPPASFGRSNAADVFAHVLNTVQRWSEHSGEGLVINEDSSEADELEVEDADDAAVEDAADEAKASP